jgi:AraC-like DNA-binding protein
LYYSDFGQDYDDSERNPWYQKYPLDPSFPFVLFDSSVETYPFHWHKYLELIYIARGHLGISINGRNFTAKEGDVVMVNSELIHGYYDGSGDVRFLVNLFGLEIFDQSLTDLREPVNKVVIFNRKTIIRAMDDPLHSKIVDLIISIKNEFSEKKDGYRIAIKKHLYEIALLFLRDMPPNNSLLVKSIKLNSNFPVLERIFSYIHTHYNNPEMNLDKAAKAANLSKFYFSRFFRERTGNTFHVYLSRFRVSRAQALLFETDEPITEIAYNSGFSSLKTFNRLFKAYTGVSPSVYRAASKGFTGDAGE